MAPPDDAPRLVPGASDQEAPGATPAPGSMATAWTTPGRPSPPGMELDAMVARARRRAFGAGERRDPVDMEFATRAYAFAACLVLIASALHVLSTVPAGIRRRMRRQVPEPRVHDA